MHMKMIWSDRDRWQTLYKLNYCSNSIQPPFGKWNDPILFFSSSWILLYGLRFFSYQDETITVAYN